jgi:hypothetical protein
MEDVLWIFGLFYGRLIYFMVIEYILYLVYISSIWYIAPRKIWQPCILTLPLEQGCQIFLSTIYQNREKYTKITK